MVKHSMTKITITRHDRQHTIGTISPKTELTTDLVKKALEFIDHIDETHNEYTPTIHVRMYELGSLEISIDGGYSLRTDRIENYSLKKIKSIGTVFKQVAEK